MPASTLGNNRVPEEVWRRLICPTCRVPLVRVERELEGACGHRYPIRHGVPLVSREYAKERRC